MERVLLDEVIETDYGQFDIVWSDEGGFDGDFDRVFAGQVNGLVGSAHSDGIYINIASRFGGSQMRVVLLEAAPGEPADEWEDVVEVSLTIPDGVELMWESWAGESSGSLGQVPGGTYRLRASELGRDLAAKEDFDEDSEEDDEPLNAPDRYLIELWPAPPMEDVILRVGSESAAYWHKECGSRR